MIEPEATAGLGRRYLAFLLDSSLVLAAGFGVAFQQSAAFAVVGRDADDAPLVDPDEFGAMRELLEFEVLGRSEILGRPIVRAQEIGDSVRIFGADSYQLGFIAAAVAALTVFGLIPMLLQRTLGMVPLGLGIKKTDGSNPGPGAHLLRSIVGVVDALPVVIPGLIGFLIARGPGLRQRLGDRVARTSVVNLHSHRLAEIPEEEVSTRLGAAAEAAGATSEGTPIDPTLAPTAVEPDPGPEEVVRSARRSKSVTVENPEPAAPPSVRSTTASLTDKSDSADPPVREPAAADGPVDETMHNVSPVTEALPSRAAQPSVAKPTFADPLPPPPVHRKPPSERPLGVVDRATSDRAADVSANTEDEKAAALASEIDAPIASVERHLTAQAPLPFNPDALEQRPIGKEAASGQALGQPAATADAAEKPDAAWQPPHETPAPVWQPAALETAPVEAPNPHDGRTLDDVVLRQPSVGALISEPATQTSRDDASSPNEAAATRAGKHSQGEPTAKAPVWSDKWRAWMYWDTSKKCWLRHDTSTNTWLPVD